LGKLANRPPVLKTARFSFLQTAKRQMFDTPVNDGLVIQASPYCSSDLPAL